MLKDGEELARIPMEDLGVLVLDGPGLSLSSSILEGVAETGAVLIACGSDHMPAAILHPIAGHSTQTERIRSQVQAAKPLRKNLWARVVRAKLLAQAAAAPHEHARRHIERIASEVRSGDSENAEGQAARSYWSTFFADCDPRIIELPFVRQRAGPPPNNLLNYGYAILRAAVVRGLCGSGLHPGIGIQHHGKYDSFALASDMMEPFRPWVDLRVRHLVRDGDLGLARHTKAHLLEVLTDPVVYAEGQGPLLAATERCCASLAEAFLAAGRGAGAHEAAALLVLPSMPSVPESDPVGEDLDQEE